MAQQSPLAPAAAPAAGNGHHPTAPADRDGAAFEALAREFVEAFNDRDADALVALAHPRIVFRPSSLVGSRETYIGHAGLRRWLDAFAAAGMEFQLQIREVRPLDADCFLVLSKVRYADELIADAAMIANVQDDTIISAHGYLSDEALLARLGVIPDTSALV